MDDGCKFGKMCTYVEGGTSREANGVTESLFCIIIVCDDKQHVLWSSQRQQCSNLCKHIVHTRQEFENNKEGEGGGGGTCV